MGNSVRSRLWPAAYFFVAGVGFVLLVERLSTVACNDGCPDWFSGLVMGQLLIPIVWALLGYASPKERRIFWLFAAAIVSCMIAYGLHLQILVYTRHAVSG